MVDRWRFVARLLSWIIVSAPLLVWIGATFQVGMLQSLLPGFQPMHSGTALLFGFCGGALLLLIGKLSTIGRAAAVLLALVVLAAGLTRLLQWNGFVGLALDWRVLEALFGPDPLPYRIAPWTAFLFIVAGMGILLLLRSEARLVVVQQLFGAIAFFGGLFVLAAHAFDAIPSMRYEAVVPMTLFASVWMTLLGAAIALARPDAGPVEVLTNDRLGGRTARRLFLAATVGPIVFGFLRLEAQNRGLFGTEFGTAVFAAAVILFLSAVVWGAARSLDRTDRLREGLEIERDRFFNLSLDMLCVAGTDGYFKRVNPAFTETLGWTQEDLLKKPFLDFVHAEDIQPTIAEMQNLEAGRPVIHFQNRYRTKDDSWRWLSWRAAPHGNQIYATARDVTEQRRAEEELVAAKAAAERASEAKSDFLSRMSHELRTPLNAVLGYAQILQMEAEDEETKELAEPILKSGRHLLNLINEVLDLARIESGKLSVSLEPVGLAPILDQALAIVKPLAEARSIRVGYTSEPCRDTFVMADRQRLMQVILNLITNGIKYNRPGGEVEVRCFPAQAGLHRIEVCDTGIGIDEEDRSRLFQPFERLGESEEEGTGLGLALSLGLIQAMQGKLELIESNETGTVFAIHLPRTESVEAPRKEPDADAEARLPQRPIKLLHVEDNLANAALVERIFRDWPNVELISAMQGSIGYELAERHVPDVILMDVHLPDMQGDALLRQLRANEVTARIPVVVLSADATERQRRRLLRGGAQAYLTKPLDLRGLLRTINEVLKEAE
jgi:PAS domain S-box-containing protein